MNAFEASRPQVEFVILADRAEVLNGKLYMMGGGWDRLTLADLSQPTGINFAVGLQIPWNFTNQELTLTLSVESEDGQGVHGDLRGSVNVGRPPDAIPGQSFHFVLAAGAPIKFPQYGGYRVVAAVGDGDPNQMIFYIVSPRTPVRGLAS